MYITMQITPRVVMTEKKYIYISGLQTATKTVKILFASEVFAEVATGDYIFTCYDIKINM